MSESLIIQNLPPAALTTVPITDTSVFSVNIKPNQNKHTRVLARCEITTAGTSAVTPITFKLKLNGVTLVDNYQGGGTANFIFQSDAVARTNQFYCEWIGDLAQGGVLTLTCATITAPDTHTTITPKSFYVVAIN
jgi:hypothetical protein